MRRARLVFQLLDVFPQMPDLDLQGVQVARGKRAVTWIKDFRAKSVLARVEWLIACGCRQNSRLEPQRFAGFSGATACLYHFSNELDHSRRGGGDAFEAVVQRG